MDAQLVPLCANYGTGGLIHEVPVANFHLLWGVRSPGGFKDTCDAREWLRNAKGPVGRLCAKTPGQPALGDWILPFD